jgi:arylsulfatase A-like enzyme
VPIGARCGRCSNSPAGTPPCPPGGLRQVALRPRAPRRHGAAALAALLLVSALAALSACRAEPKPRHLVLILVDTLRADHLGAYGYARPTSPVFDAFAREGGLFDDARSQASCTYPSVNSLLTSRSPEAFLGQPDRAMGIPAGVPALAELLAGQGYRTAAVSASPIVRTSPSRFNPGGGFGRGFAAFDETCLWQDAACINRQALPHLQAASTNRDPRPLFLYLHYMDPHGPYRPPAGHRRRFATGGSDKEFIRRGDPNPLGDWLYKGTPDPGVTPADLQHLVDLYDEEIASFDEQLGRLLAAIDAAGLRDETLVVVASDHGEEFLEHGHIKHCRTLFDTSIRVPLALRGPGIVPGVRTVQAQNLDLVPTVLDLLGVAAPGLPFEGRSLAPALRGEVMPPGHQFAVQGPLRSASDHRHKLIADLAQGRYALYDLQADPAETEDVLREDRDRRAFGALRQALNARLARADASGAGLQAAQEAEKKLRSLGYLE